MSTPLWHEATKLAGIQVQRVETPPKGIYAVWWQSQSDPDARTSPTLVAVGNTMQTASRWLTYMIGDLFAALEVPGPREMRLLPPGAGERNIPVRLSTGAHALLTVSSAQGLLWKCDTSLAIQHRDLFWAITAQWASAMDRILTKIDAPRDDPGVTSCTQWWGMQRAIIDGKLPESGPVQAIGMVEV